MRRRFRTCVKKIRQRTKATTCAYQRIMASIPVEVQFNVFIGATEVEEFPLLAGEHPPSEAALRARAKSSPAWHDPSFLAYDFILFRRHGLRPGGYNGCAAAQRSTSPGGGASRASSHLVALGKGEKTRFYDFVRANEGDLGLYLHFRIDVSELTERSALLQAARCVCQYISEVSRTQDHPL